MAQELLGSGWRDGAVLPAESRLQSRYGASRNTVRKALDLLAEQGLIERGQGRVARVASPVFVRSLNELCDFHSSVRASGKTPQTRVIKWEQAEGTLQTDVYFGAGPTKLCRLRLVDHQPVVYQRVYLPDWARLAWARSALHNASLYQLLAARGDPVQSVTDVLSACTASEEVAEALRIDVGEVLIQADRVGMGSKGDVLEISRAYVKPGHFRFEASSRAGG